MTAPALAPARADARGTVWDTLLLVAIVGTAAFGGVMLLLHDLTRDLFDLVAFLGEPSPVTPEAEHFLSFFYGVTGAVMIGWTIALLGLARGPLLRRERWAWTTLAASVTGWFVIDSVFSAAMGFPGNVVLNTGLAIAFWIPLAMIRRDLPRI